MENSNFAKMAAINVNSHTEKKNGLTYLSWAWAWDQLLRVDPNANYEFHDIQQCGKDTYMVSCTVTAFGIPRRMHLPVMDHRNKAIADPDAFEVNKAMMRCLVKAIALHGLGLYIYAGEDLPEGETFDISVWTTTMEACASKDELKTAYLAAKKACFGSAEAIKTLDTLGKQLAEKFQ